jgi:hypothetical protein
LRAATATQTSEDSYSQRSLAHRAEPQPARG